MMGSRFAPTFTAATAALATVAVASAIATPTGTPAASAPTWTAIAALSGSMTAGELGRRKGGESDWETIVRGATACDGGGGCFDTAGPTRNLRGLSAAL